MSLDVGYGGPRSALASADDVPARRRGRAAAAAALAVLVLTALVVLLHPSGPVQGAQTQTIRGTGVTGGLNPGMVVQQPVRATQDGLERIQAVFGTYGAVTRCAIDVAVSDPAGTVLDRERLPCRALVDNAPVVVASFPKIADSAGTTYQVRYSAAPDGGPQQVALLIGKPADVALPARVTGAAPDVVALFARGTATSTVLEYAGGSTWKQIGLALDRIALGAPWWSQPLAMRLWLIGGVLAAAGALLTAGRRWGVSTTLVLCVVLLRGLIWASALPPLEGMDESAHVAYSQFIAEQGRLPQAGTRYQDRRNYYSAQMTVLEDFRNRDGLNPADRADLTPAAMKRLEVDLQAASPRSNGAAPAAGYPPAYYLPAAAIYALTPGSFNDRVYAMRLWSVALGVLASWWTLLAARRLFPRRAITPVLLTLAVALQPMIAHQFAIVNNDAFVIAAGAGGFAMALKLASGRFRTRDVALAGGFLGLALLGKPFGIGLLPVLLVGLLIGSWSGPVRLRRLGLGVLGGLTGLAGTYGVWVLTRLALGLPPATLPAPDTNGPLGRGLTDFVRLQVQDGFARTRLRWGDQLFGMFAWLDVKLPPLAYDAVWLFMVTTAALSLVWVVWQLGRTLTRSRSRPESVARVDQARATWVTLAMVAGVFGALLAAGYLSFRRDGHDELLQGRYALMAMPAILALPALTLAGLRGGRWARVLPVVAVTGVAMGMLALNVLGLAAIVDRFYL